MAGQRQQCHRGGGYGAVHDDLAGHEPFGLGGLCLEEAEVLGFRISDRKRRNKLVRGWD